MPAPIVPALIAAGSSLASSGINAASQASMNKKTRKWNEKMHALQRQESLADYHMQNEYNHPSSQMARLKAAGLNPNLVYGNGATTESASIKPAGVEGWSPDAPQVNLGAAASAGISAYYDSQISSQTVDNLRKQNTVIANEALLKEAQTLATIAGTDMTKFDLEQKNRLKDISAQAAELNLRKMETDMEQTRANTKYTLDENDRKAAMQASTLQQAVENILTSRLTRTKIEAEKAHIRQQIENLKNDNKIKELEIKLREQGVNPGDPAWWRILNKAIPSLPGIPQNEAGRQGARDGFRRGFLNPRPQ